MPSSRRITAEARSSLPATGEGITVAESIFPFPLRWVVLVLRGQKGLSQVAFWPVLGKKYSSHSSQTEPMSAGFWRELVGIVNTSRMKGTISFLDPGTNTEESLEALFIYHPGEEWRPKRQAREWIK